MLGLFLLLVILDWLMFLFLLRRLFLFSFLRWLLNFSYFRRLNLSLCWFWFIGLLLLGFFFNSGNLMSGFDVACSFLRRLRAGVLHVGIDFDGTESALVNAKVSAVVGIVLELHDSVGEERGVREVSKCQFGE